MKILKYIKPKSTFTSATFDTSFSRTETQTMKDDSDTSFDRISELPCNILHIILMFLPLRDMARTSILSKNWRYEWLRVPHMVFKDDPKYFLAYEEKYRYSMMKVFGILLLHQGPILKATVDMTGWANGPGIDQIITFLSRNGIKELTLLMSVRERCHKLSSSILSCVGLRHLSLYGCVFQPLTFAGFSSLVSLELLKVKLFPDVSISSCPLLEILKLDNLCYFDRFSVDAPNLKTLIFKGEFCRISYMNTPILQVLSLTGLVNFRLEDSKFDLMKLIQSLPLLENLHLDYRFLEFLAVGDSLNESTSMLDKLKVLQVTDTPLVFNNLSATLWLIRNSPNLRKLKVKLSGHLYSEKLLDLELDLKMQERSHYSLKLQEIEMELSPNRLHLRRDIKFMKFVLDVSPELETLYLKLRWELFDASGYKMLIDLACYPRASPKSRLVYVDLDVSEA